MHTRTTHNTGSSLKTRRERSSKYLNYLALFSPPLTARFLLQSQTATLNKNKGEERRGGACCLLTCHCRQGADLEVRGGLADVGVGLEVVAEQVPLHDAAHVQLTVVQEERLLQLSVEGEVLGFLVQPDNCCSAGGIRT